ncbi:MAG: glycosyltransferase family 39 protein [Thermomicrobiales bacterium]
MVVSAPSAPATPHPQACRHTGHIALAIADVLWLAVAMLLGLALRIPFFALPIIPDEGGYAYATRGWLDGSGQLYHDLWISRPQGIFYVYAIVMQTLGDNVLAFRFAAWAAAALTTVAVWLFARRWAGRRIGNLAAIAFALISAAPTIEGFTANAEVFMALPAAFAAVVLLHASRHGWKTPLLILTGVLIGLATIVKPSGAFMLPVAWGFIVLTVEAPHREYRNRSLAVLAGTVLVAVPIFIHGYVLGWSDFIYATITYRMFNQSSVSVGMAHNLYRLGAMLLYALPWLVLLVLVLGVRHRTALRRALCEGHLLLARKLRVRFDRRWLERALGLTAPLPSQNYHLVRPSDAAGLLLRLWALGCLGGIAMGGDWWPHYLMQIAAPAAIWIANVGDTVVHDLERRQTRIALTAAIVLLLVSPYALLVRGSVDAMTETIYGHPGYLAQSDVATYIRDHTTPDDTIYVAFDQAGIYYLADRKPAYRHLYDQELRGIPTSYGDLISLIQGPDRPLYIVGTLHPGPFPDDSRLFWQEVGKYYTLETTIDGVPIYRALDGS